MLIKARIKCLATYDAVVEIPDGVKNIEEYILYEEPDLDVSNLQFYEDLDHGFLMSYQIVENNCPDQKA